MPIDNPEDFLDAADSFLGKIEQSRLVSKKELETVRRNLTRDMKREAKTGVQLLGTARVGAAKILVPNQQNLSGLNLSSERVKERFTNFRLSFLDRAQVDDLTSDGRSMPGDTRKFIRHSRRLARHAREFLNRIEELEPDLAEEVQETLLQIEDNDMDLLKLETKSFTRMRETMLRGVQGRKQRSEVSNEVETFDLNRNLWNLSLLEHPAAAVRGLLANASERMGSRVARTESEIPKVAHVLVGVPPDAQEKMTPGSRTARIAWRLFSNDELDKRFEKLPPRQASPTSWRGLGLDFNTTEFYLPVPPEIAEGLAPLARARRAALLATLAKAQQEGAL